jgi:glycosyltransferase involved in cell wall biosynthesis
MTRPVHTEGPLKILHVDSERSWRGGERQVLELIRRQRARGDEPHLAAPRGSALLSRASSEGFAGHAVPMRGTWDVSSALALAELHRRLRPDVVHWHAARAHALGAMASLFAPGPARVLSRRVDFRVRGSVGSRLLYGLRREATIAISDGVRDALVESGLDPAGIRVVRSGIDLAPYEAPFDRAAIKARLGTREGDFLVLQVAALAPHKSQKDLLQAARIILDQRPEAMVWIAGEGILRDELERQHGALDLGDRVRLLGFRDDVPDLLRAADLFCVSSYLEGMGTATLDAMAAGLPVVATCVGGIPEIVEDGVTGLLVPPREPEALAGAILALASDPDRRRAMGERARERVRDFSADRTEEETRRVYLEAIGTVD